ncbi:PilZ domain-containing protein [Sphingomonas sp. BGYR3]|uniref:PilZ domain-containing protein n=1 Tax=Sphingomonas sp. BGYR3 TaxID=2975483 RepID=UPI0021A4EE07|nr:PilZ domain-containing protein [Sphingomonas sp. BGYR3]MDG5487378.1 PilZ domain-containing protein [Sphingomonas sp. BGYR3]
MTTAARHHRFAAEFEPAMLFGSRHMARTPVSLDARIGRGGLDRALCRVTDLSREGARLETYSALTLGALIWLTIPTIGPRIAEVRWTDEFAAGVRFQEPLAEDEYERMIGLD